MHRPVADALASVIDASSEVESGCTLTFYSLADVLQEVYTDIDWVTPASTAGVLTANSAGRFPKAFFKDDLDYKAVLKDSGGSTIVTINPIYKAAGFLVASDLSGYLQKAGGAMTGPLRWAEGAAIASASAIDLDAATGNFLHITGTTNISTITLAQGAERIVVFDGVLTIAHSANLLLGGANITTQAGMILRFIGEGGGVTRLIGGMTATGKAIFESFIYQMGIGDESTAITSGNAKITTRAPCAFELTEVRGSLTTAQPGGSILTFDVNIASASVFSTRLTIDNNETTSTTAATAAVLTSSVVSVTDDSLITVDFDQVGTSGATGVKLALIGYKRNS
jgi:hypothetical protein